MALSTTIPEANARPAREMVFRDLSNSFRKIKVEITEIGMLNPMISEELWEAEQIYPHSWIEDAFREAVSRNRRSWKYIAAILERWEREGRGDGEPGRHPKKAGYEEYFRR